MSPILLGFILFLNLFFFRQVGSLGWIVLMGGCWTFLTLSYRRWLHLPEVAQAAAGSGFVLLLTSWWLWQRANPTIVFTLFVIQLFTLVVFYYSLSSRRVLLSLLELVWTPWTVGWAYLRSLVSWRLTPLHSSARPSSMPHWGWLTTSLSRSIVVGGIISAPVILILIALLSAADPIFGHLIKDQFGSQFIEHALWRGVYSFGFLIALSPLLRTHYPEAFTAPLAARWKNAAMSIEYTIVMSLVAIVLALFLSVQWQYIFIPSVRGVDLTQFGFKTYSEYVQKGFWEFVVAALFIFGLIWGGLWIVQNHRARYSHLLKAVQLGVLVEFLVMLLSFFRRIWLYQEYHGLTLVRVFGGWFVVWIAILAVILGARHLKPWRWVLADIAATLLVLFFLSSINIERYIAVAHPPTVNDRVDYTYLARLSADGVEGWQAALEYAQTVLNQPAYDSNQVGLIQRNERREVAYAGVVTAQLLKNYWTLLQQYGTPAQQLVAFRLVHEDALAQVQAVQAKVAAKITEQERLMFISNANPSSDNPEFMRTGAQIVSNLKSYQDQLARHGEKLSHNLELLNQASGDTNRIKVSVILPVTYRYSSGPSLSDSNCQKVGYCTARQYSTQYLPHTFFDIEKASDKTGTSKTLLDQIFIHNWSEESAFTQLEKKLPLVDLLLLQDHYFSLVERINQQPTEEQVYDTDIDLDVPFLPSF